MTANNMKSLLKILKKNPKLYGKLRLIYGKTLGGWWFKEWYAKKIGFYNGDKRVKLLNEENASKLITEKIQSNKPFMLGRYGSTEFKALFSGKEEIHNLCFYGGVFPESEEIFNKFKKEYFDASKSMDILAIWNYQNHFLNKIKWLKNFPNINNLIPLGVVGQETSGWIKSLKGKKVLVINAFEATMKQQYKKRKELGILPELKSLEILKSVQTLGLKKDDRFETWFDALDYMKKEIDKKDFDIALIGCGSYALPLSAYVKSIGKQSIHMGGSIQLLFGIKGKRWDNAGIYTKDWTYLLEEDTPSNSKIIEGGCYWK